MKAWRVTDVQPDGTATFEHSVERVDMRQKLTGRDEVRYNSQTDAKPPVGFEDVAQSVGVPLSVVTMDAKGKVLHRDRRRKAATGGRAAQVAAQSEGWMTIPLPDEAVPVGHTWSLPQDIDIPLETGGVKRIKAIQQFTLEDVKTGVATIRVSTEILTPITDPAIESQLVQRESSRPGAIRHRRRPHPRPADGHRQARGRFPRRRQQHPLRQPLLRATPAGTGQEWHGRN